VRPERVRKRDPAVTFMFLPLDVGGFAVVHPHCPNRGCTVVA
jgi:hypothetical protein